jgi:hypothetical protein
MPFPAGSEDGTGQKLTRSCEGYRSREERGSKGEEDTAGREGGDERPGIDDDMMRHYEKKQHDLLCGHD